MPTAAVSLKVRCTMTICAGPGWLNCCRHRHTDAVAVRRSRGRSVCDQCCQEYGIKSSAAGIAVENVSVPNNWLRACARLSVSEQGHRCLVRISVFLLRRDPVVDWRLFLVRSAEVRRTDNCNIGRVRHDIRRLVQTVQDRVSNLPMAE